VHSEGISYKPRSGEIGMCLQVGRMGPQVRMERDSTTRSGARAPGVGRPRPLERRCFSAQRPPAQNGDPTRGAGSTKGGGKPSDVQAASNGQALSDTPALKPYWGKPAVRNFREGNGNVGIIRSPLRAHCSTRPIKCFQISVIRRTRNQVRIHIHRRRSPNSGTSTPPMIPAGSCGGAGRRRW